MKFTIITPSYNQGKFIERTILSVLNQGIVDLEYLVFDGGSTDETVAILEKYKDQLRYISEKDEGQSDAVNKGLYMASGEIIGWLNSDDVYYEGAFRKIHALFEAHPEVDVIYGRADHIDEADQYIEDYYTETWNYDRLKDVCYICQPAVFFRKTVIEQFGVLDKQLKYCMDYEYWLRIGQIKPFYYLDSKIAGSRLYSENKTLGNRVAVHDEIIRTLSNMFVPAPTRWIYNLAHIIAEDAGYCRETPELNYKFVRRMVLSACWNFVKYQRKIPLVEIKTMLSWVKHARLSARGR